MWSNSPPTLTGAGHQWTTPTSRGHFQSWFSQWEPLVATHIGTHHSLVTHTSKCGWAISWDMYGTHLWSRRQNLHRKQSSDGSRIHIGQQNPLPALTHKEGHSHHHHIISPASLNHCIPSINQSGLLCPFYNLNAYLGTVGMNTPSLCVRKVGLEVALIVVDRRRWWMH